MEGLAQRTALVTGGSRGIGRAIALALGRAGCHRVVITATGESEPSRDTVAELEAMDVRASAVYFDLKDNEATEGAMGQLLSEVGTVDILVNNAGVAKDGLLMRVTEAAMVDSWRTNVLGATLCTKALIRPMMRSRWGRVVFVSSVVAEAGNAGQAVYGSTKAALIGLTKGLAREYASRGITVNAVAPGFIETDMTASLGDEVRAQVLSDIPLGRMGTPEDVAKAVVFLASDFGSYITGQVLRVNGGLYV